ncbi:MAG: ParB/RepB/Spo0J family partition protein [Alcaligenes nematophilus]|uniref:ParB/RepB/Spo0J family partition protein n=1 Tax=Alcaligenes nematophilus TaxID=2994643 RepID=UPI003D040E55
MSTFKRMIGDKTIKRADAMKIRLEDIHEEPGFNLRDETAVDADGVSFEESIRALAEFIGAGGTYPALEVRPREEGGVWVVDGYRRRRALTLLDSEGKLPRTPARDGGPPEAWISIVPFEGSDAERTLRILTSVENRRLGALEVARGYRRLANFGWTTTQIAQGVHKSRTHVEQMLMLANSNSDVQRAINSGQVSASAAVGLVRQHGEQAGQIIEQAAERAQDEGKTKVTPRMLTDRPRLTVKAIAPPLQKFLRSAVEYERTEQGGTDYVLVPAQALLDLQAIMNTEKEE